MALVGGVLAAYAIGGGIISIGSLVGFFTVLGIVAPARRARSDRLTGTRVTCRPPARDRESHPPRRFAGTFASG
jgi:hypothetical protein